MIGYRVNEATRSPHEHSDLRAELVAMQAVAEAVALLPAAARARVLRWTAERFAADGAHATMSTGADRAAIRPAPAALTLVHARQAAMNDPGLAVTGLETLFETEKMEEPGAPPEEPVATSEQPVASMISHFVADFQKLARDWSPE
jgi:hypothetical protein